MCKPKTGGTTFTELVDLVSMIDPEMRVRFTSPHPKVLSNYSGLRLLLPATATSLKGKSSYSFL